MFVYGCETRPLILYEELKLMLGRILGPGVDSASNRNEYQEYFLGVKAAGA